MLPFINIFADCTEFHYNSSSSPPSSSSCYFPTEEPSRSEWMAFNNVMKNPCAPVNHHQWWYQKYITLSKGVSPICNMWVYCVYNIFCIELIHPFIHDYLNFVGFQKKLCKHICVCLCVNRESVQCSMFIQHIVIQAHTIFHILLGKLAIEKTSGCEWSHWKFEWKIYILFLHDCLYACVQTYNRK